MSEFWSPGRGRCPLHKGIGPLVIVAMVMLLAQASPVSAAPRDVQMRTVDFRGQTVELFNFGEDAQSLAGWRFCTHDNNEFRRYTRTNALNGVSIDPGESFFIHLANDAGNDPNDDRINVSELGGFAGPFTNDVFSAGLYMNSGFAIGANLADHVQWSIGGADNTIADERSDEAESGGVWTDQSAWIATTSQTIRLALRDVTGGVLHGPEDYAVVVPGDFDTDGDVDAFDLGIWQSGFGTASAARLEDGDADGDGDVDAFDLGIWQTNFGFGTASGVTTVPEPTAALAWCGLALWGLGRQWNWRR